MTIFKSQPHIKTKATMGVIENLIYLKMFLKIDNEKPAIFRFMPAWKNHRISLVPKKILVRSLEFSVMYYVSHYWRI